LNGGALGTAQIQTTSTSGQYVVVITDGAGCQATDTINLLIGTPISASITGPATAQLGATVTFTNTTTGGQPGWNWIWNFGNGNTATGPANQSTTYTEPGNYPVFLIVNDAVCADTATLTLFIEANCATSSPVAQFTAQPDSINLALGGLIQLQNTSTGAVEYNWDFGNGTGSTSISPTASYANPGTYTIILQAIYYNCTTTVSQTVTVVNQSLLLGELSETGVVSLYPNPASGWLNVSLNAMPTQPAQFALLDALGRIVPLPQLEAVPATEYTLQLTDVPPGVYLLRVQVGQAASTHRIVIQRP
jgi:PKD repeat protein